jgi:hypothetical protein
VSEVIDTRPVEFTIQEQQLMHSYTIKEQGLFHFLVRPAAAEGDVRGRLRSVTIKHVDKGQWVTEELVARARERLSTQGSIPLQHLLTEIERRGQGRRGYQLQHTPVALSTPRQDAILSPPTYADNLPHEAQNQVHTHDDDEEQYLAEDA